MMGSWEGQGAEKQEGVGGENREAKGKVGSRKEGKTAMQCQSLRLEEETT